VDILAVIRDRAGEYDCPVCHRALDGCELSLVKDEDPVYTVQVSCAHCGVTFEVVLHVRHGRRRIRPPAPPPQAPPIGTDEVLDVRELLRAHTGSLTELLRR
jgi:hypothetical protein